MIQSKTNLSESFKNRMAVSSAYTIHISFIYTHVLHSDGHRMHSPVDI
jgi:hypothetical protein